MNLILSAERKLKELRSMKLEMLHEKQKIPNSLLKEIIYHRKVIELVNKNNINKYLVK